MSQTVGSKQFRFWMTILLVVTAGSSGFLIPPVSAEEPAVTISADGDQSYYLGEKVVLRGTSPGADTVYLFMTGPNLQENGVQLTSPKQAVVGGNTETFTVVKPNPDSTWEYSFYTANLPFDAGSYSIYAAGEAKSLDILDERVSPLKIILKKPFITGEISSSTIAQGEPFTITGTAEGDPAEVQVWILGLNHASTTRVPVNPDASFLFSAGSAMSGDLPAGQYHLIVQHSMVNNQFDIVVAGDNVCDLLTNGGREVFRLTGPGSLRGTDAADALVAAFSEQEANDTTHSSDTYTIVPFQVTAAGDPATSAPAAVPTTGEENQTRPTALLPLTLLGIFVLVVGMVIWKRQ